MKPLTVEELTQKIDGRLCAGQGAAQREVRSGCVCDLLSWVMARAKKGTAWVTVQTHMNVVAVAELLEIACVIFPDGMEADAAVHAQPPRPLSTRADVAAHLAREELRLISHRLGGHNKLRRGGHVIAVGTRQQPPHPDIALEELIHPELGAPRRRADDRHRVLFGEGNDKAVAVEALREQGAVDRIVCLPDVDA